MCKRLLSLLLSLLLLTGPALAMEGMDISTFQGDVDLSAAKAGGIQVVYIRASYGQAGVDARFSQNHAAAQAAGLPFGFYHYLESETPEGARLEAEHFAGLIASTGYTYRPALDFEGHRSLTPAQATAAALAFLTRLEELTGVRPMIYADHSTASTQFGPALAQYPLWLAQWQVDAPDLSGTPWSQWAGWQYTNVGLVPGITGHVDRDHFTEEVLLQEEPSSFLYTVRRGDTLWALSRRFGTTIARLAEDNHIPDPDLIYVGQTLRIPGHAPQVKEYTVRPGDTLWAISRSHGATVTQLVRLNHIPDPDLIYPGQVLTLP